MITIRLDEPIHLNNSVKQLSAFVSFDYDATVVEIIKSLGTRVWDDKLKAWEIPSLSVPSLVKRLRGRDLEILGVYEEAPRSQQLLPDNFSFKTAPFTHQIEGVSFALAHETFILGDEQGLGKTKQIIDIAIARKLRGDIKRCLIICGVNGLKYNWVEEVLKHSNEKCWVLGTRFRKTTRKEYEGDFKDKLYDVKNMPEDIFFVITNIETLKAGSYVLPGYEKKKYKKYAYPIVMELNRQIENGEYGMIAFDEFHKVRNPDTHQGKALLQLNDKYKIPMTGTPLVNSPLDLYIALKWTGLDDHTFYEFKKHYCKYGGFNNTDITGYKNMDELHDITRTNMLRRKKNDVLDLPPKLYTDYLIDMYPEQNKLYLEIKAGLKKQLASIRLSTNPLDQIIRLRQATAYCGIVSTTVINSAKMDYMIDLVDDIVENGNKCLVFSNWSEVTYVAKQLLAKHNPAYITGEVNPLDRKKEEHKLQEDDTCKVAIGTIGAMGTGLTLTAATYVIFLDEPWNRAIKDQACDRTHRIGTTGTINIITLMCKESVDEWVHSIVNKKGAISDLLIDGSMNGTTFKVREVLLAEIEKLLS